MIEIHFDAVGLKMPMADGDILRVLSIVPKFDNAVTLRGNVANPGRYPWHAGMRITDLIPKQRRFTDKDYWKRKNSLVFTNLDGPHRLPAQTRSGTRQAAGVRGGRFARAIDRRDEDDGNSATAAAAVNPEEKNRAFAGE